MPMAKRPPEPTKLELEVLHAFWERGDATARDVVDDLGRVRRVSVTGISTTIRRMIDKGLLRITDARKPQRFAAVQTREETYEASLTGLNRRFSRGSIVDLVRGLLGTAKPTKAEVDEVKRILNEHKVRRDGR